MMGHDEEPHTAGDVVAYYEQLRIEGGRPFLLYMDGVLMGDADFRNIAGVRGEFAIMIGGRASQGRGLGTRFALMLHAFGYDVLGPRADLHLGDPGQRARRAGFSKSSAMSPTTAPRRARSSTRRPT